MIYRSNSKIVFPIGTSGSGKTTWVNTLPKGEYVIISPDEIRKELTGDISNKSKDKEVYEKVDQIVVDVLLDDDRKIIIDSTNLKTEQRRAFIRNIQSKFKDVRFEYKLFELNPEEAKSRIKADVDSGVDRAIVPDTTIDRHAILYKQMLKDIKQEPLTEFMVDIRELKVGDKFKYPMRNPKGYLDLKIIKIEDNTDIPWCEVIKHHYEEPAEDEYDEFDRYKTGDEFPYCYSGEVEVI